MHLSNNHRRGLRAGLAFGVLSASMVASAATQFFNFSLTNGAERTNFERTIDISKFNTNLGTLTSVDVKLDWAGQISGTVKNLSQQANTVTVVHKLNLELMTRDESTLDKRTVLQGGLTNRGVAVNGSTSYGPMTESGSYTFSTAVNSANRSRFIGSGLIDLAVLATGVTTRTTTNGDVEIKSDTYANLSGTVSYNYQPVPEPASMAALGVGVLGLVRRNRKKVSK